MRFNSAEHLMQWQDSGIFPAIHRPMVEAVHWAASGNRFLDLGCCHGLLGAAVAASRAGAYVIGVEVSPGSITLGQTAGIPLQIIQMRVDSGTLGAFAALLRRHRIDTILARRVLPELWGKDLAGGRAFARVCAAAGVQQFFIEGRRPSPNPINPLDSIDREVALMSPVYREAGRLPKSDAVVVLERAQSGRIMPRS